mgnify:CR=1 FL=1
MKIAKKKWIALYTKPRHEKVVYQKLEKKGFEVYLPLIKLKRAWKDREKWIDQPLFKSYVFVNIELKNSLFLLNTSGVVKIVKFGNKIIPVQNDDIKSLKILLKGNFDVQPIDYFLHGDKVIVKNGPLRGFKGEIIQFQNKHRLMIRIDSIQNSVSIQIEKKFLKKI